MTNGAPAHATGDASPGPMAILTIVFGVGTWVFLPILGAIVALITGNLAKEELRKDPSSTGETLRKVGVILAAVHLVLAVVALVVFLLFIGLVAGGMRGMMPLEMVAFL